MKNTNEILHRTDGGAERASSRDDGFDSLRETPERSPAEQFYQSAAEMEQDFAKRLTYFENKGGEMSYAEFKRYEDMLTSRLEMAELNNLAFTPAELAAATRPFTSYLRRGGLGHSVEGYAGHFFVERTDELGQAMAANGEFSDEEKRNDRDVLNDFTKKAGKHRELVEMWDNVDAYRKAYGKDRAGGMAYERDRTTAHDNIIGQINQMNDIARKYGATPFLPYRLEPIHYDPQTASVDQVEQVKNNRKIAELFYRGVADSLNRKKYGPDYKEIIARRDKMAEKYLLED